MSVPQYAVDIKQPDIGAAFGAYRQGMQDRQIQQQQQDQSALKKYLPAAIGGDRSAVANVAGIDPQLGMKLQEHLATLDSNKLEQTKRQWDIGGAILNGVKDQAGLDAAKPQLLQAGVPDELVNNMTLDQVPKLVAMSPTVQAGIDKELNRRNITSEIATRGASLAEERRHNMAGESIAADKATAAKVVNPDFVKAVANYDAQLPSTRSPDYQAAVAAAKAANPDFKEGEYKLRNSAKQAFNTGTQGNAVRSTNAALEHMETLRALGNALKTGNVQIINRAKQAWQQQFGSPAPNNFAVASQIVGDEVIKSIVPGQSGQAEREAAGKAAQQYGSPDQINGAIDTWKPLLAGQLRAFKRQYEFSTKAKDFPDMLGDSAKALLGGAPAAPAGPTGAAPPADGWKIERVSP